MEIINDLKNVKVSSEWLRKPLLSLQARLREDGLARKYAGDEPPLRAELFSSDQMKEHGKNLAASHKLSPEPASDQLLKRLTEDEEVLLGVRKLLTEAVASDRRADVYALAPHVGRGGWTWYTGSAGWMYRLIVESLLGLRLEVDKLYFTPCLPADWATFKVHYRYRDSVYHIAVLQTPAADGVATVTVDGVERTDNTVLLVDDRQEHSVEVRIAHAIDEMVQIGSARLNPFLVRAPSPALFQAVMALLVTKSRKAASGFSPSAADGCGGWI